MGNVADLGEHRGIASSEYNGYGIGNGMAPPWDPAPFIRLPPIDDPKVSAPTEAAARWFAASDHGLSRIPPTTRSRSASLKLLASVLLMVIDCSHLSEGPFPRAGRRTQREFGSKHMVM